MHSSVICCTHRIITNKTFSTVEDQVEFQKDRIRTTTAPGGSGTKKGCHTPVCVILLSSFPSLISLTQCLRPPWLMFVAQ